MYDSADKPAADRSPKVMDHQFRYEHRSYLGVKEHLRCALRGVDDVIVVTGAPGSGKTTLARDLLEGIDPAQTSVASLLGSQLEDGNVLDRVAAQFGVETERRDKALVLQATRLFLASLRERNRSALLVIDEADELPSNGLDELGRLASVEPRGEPRLKLLLLGQERLRERFAAPEHASLARRISVELRLAPLAVNEVASYVSALLRHADKGIEPHIGEDAVQMLHRYSCGIPRWLNLIVDRLPTHSSVDRNHAIAADDVAPVMSSLRAEMLGPLHADRDGEITTEPDELADDLADPDFAANATAFPDRARTDELAEDLSDAAATTSTQTVDMKDAVADPEDTTSMEEQRSTDDDYGPAYNRRALIAAVAVCASLVTIYVKGDAILNFAASKAGAGIAALVGNTAGGVTPERETLSPPRPTPEKNPTAADAPQTREDETNPAPAPSISPPRVAAADASGPTPTIQPADEAQRVSALTRLVDALRPGATETIRLAEGGFKLLFSNDLAFEYGNAKIKPSFRAMLDTLADATAPLDIAVVQIYGESNDDVAEGLNRELSKRRAQAVSGYLAARGVANERLSAEWWGPEELERHSIVGEGSEPVRRLEISIRPASQD